METLHGWRHPKWERLKHLFRGSVTIPADKEHPGFCNGVVWTLEETTFLGLYPEHGAVIL